MSPLPPNPSLETRSFCLRLLLEQLLSASTVIVPADRRPDQNFDSFNPYSLAAARAEQSQWQDTKQQLPQPLTFRLVNSKNGNVVHAGIREFSAEEGEVGLSPFLLEALGLDAPKPKTRRSIVKPGSEDGMDAPIDLTGDDEIVEGEEEPAKITIHAKQLPKGTYVRLRPLEAGYNPADWKSLLERHMRDNFTTLTTGEILTVRGSKSEEFRFLIDKFAPEGDGICVVDTDLEVDIEALNEEQARETMKQIMAKAQKAPGTAEGSTVGGEIDIWKPFLGQVVSGEYVDYTLPSWDRTQTIQIELTAEDGQELYFFASPFSARQRVRPREDEHVFEMFGNESVKQHIIQPSDIELQNAEALYISVYGSPLQSSSQPTKFSLRVQLIPTAGSAENPLPLDDLQLDTEMHSPDEEQCKNCQQYIPKRTMMLHENFCLRNNILCPECKVVFQKKSEDWKNHWHCPHDNYSGNTLASKTNHDSIFHTPHPCPSCPVISSSLPDLAFHRTSVCPGKLILCQFCHLEVPQEGDPFSPSADSLISGLTAHELADGARTTDCHLCSKIVRLRDMSTHLKHHALERENRSPPAICRNVNCGRTLDGVGSHGEIGAGRRTGQGNGNTLGVCSICYGPLYANVHDPTNSRLARRVERNYLRQMIQGCGKPYCRNAYCKTGKANLAGEKPKPMTAQEALPLIKPLADSALDMEKGMYLCTDDVSQKRRKLAEMLAAEGEYRLEWCVAALEAEGGKVEGARGWLGNWAPKGN